jgi:multicomponent Na+:H+ antiporter subunit E
MFPRVRATYVMQLAVWIVLTGSLSLSALVSGLAGILVARGVFGRVFLRGAKNRSLADVAVRGWVAIRLIPIFLSEAFSAAVILAYMAMQPRLRFRSGVIRVPTTLKNRFAITVLANLVTLSPGTMTLDFDHEESCYYIHCVDLRDLDLEGEAGRRAVIERFEEPLRRIFE